MYVSSHDLRTAEKVGYVPSPTQNLLERPYELLGSRTSTTKTSKKAVSIKNLMYCFPSTVMLKNLK